MRRNSSLLSVRIAAVLAASAALGVVGHAQDRQTGGTVEDQFVLPVPTVEKPPRDKAPFPIWLFTDRSSVS